MYLKMSLSEYLQNGGTLETLHKSGVSIIDTYQQSPFLERNVGRISSLKLINEEKRLYEVTYASGVVRPSLSEIWIVVNAKIKLDFD
jgi:hypothetical protein